MRRLTGGIAATLAGTALVGLSLTGCGASAKPASPSPVAAIEHVTPSRPAKPEKLDRSPPMLLSIPRLGITVKPTRLGLRPDGTVEVPPLDRPEEAGWYSRGASPGERGGAVILGHVDGRGKAGVFHKLHTLRRDDTITVNRADHTVVTFAVESVEQVAKSRFPAQRVYGDPGHPGLRLVTCGGTFDKATGHYSDNVVVYARSVTTGAGKG
ncbi:class F sortase [Sinosporangium siamense]|uniref:Class F sortase n=1 Tax=Sinosporangium siamense TaxID=1367973 RepID=A0A919RAX0_9ACTN|nr:class F sortase [Sinosporangium siamense]GII90147.1 class F sortase [Sinosporangium siamense]